MKKSVLLVIFMITCFLLHGQSPTTFAEAIQRADQICSKTFSDNDFPGLAVAVSYHGIPIWKKGYRHTDIENQKAVHPDSSLFRIGSVSKTLTSIALGQLIERGSIDVDADVRKFVPYFPEKQHSMTVKQVAGHIAGIRHYMGIEFMSNEYYPDIKSSLKIFMNDDLLFEPGEKYSYSSYGWNLISAVIEEASGVPFLEYMQQNVFDKARMWNTHPDLNSRHMDQRVKFYIRSGDKNVIAPEVDNSYKWAGGGFIGTATDLLRFNRNVFNKTLISKSTFIELTTPQTLNNGKTTNYGMGWRATEDKKGRKWISHGGGSVGVPQCTLLIRNTGLR